MRRNGFYLIELIVVLMLIGISLALIVPSLSRLSQTIELKTAARGISGILRYYRSEAVHQKLTYQILFDPESKEIRVLPLELEEEDRTREEGYAKKRFEKTHALPEGIRFKEISFEPPQFPSRLPSIEFYTGGGSNGGVLSIGTEEKPGYKIKIHFITGMVEIEGA